MSELPAASDSTADRRYSRTVFWRVGLLAFAIALGFAAYTDHVWEDYYITYRTSKNLATGNGLVYTEGERLHTFTSPLGVLLPAVASLLTFNSSDTAALWIFRVMCAAALGAAAMLLCAFAQARRYGAIAATVLVGLLVTDSKIVDFSINGMETAWMMAFLAYAIWALYSRRTDGWRHLGLAWAGLMWTRPDSFIYIAALSAGVWLFNDPRLTGLRRSGWVASYLKAGLVTTAVYLPWFVFAWVYYGTPVPHTVTAKSMMNDPGGLWGILGAAKSFPFAGLEGRLALDSTFLPSYFDMGGWPGWAVTLGRVVAWACALVWVLPFLARETRAFSFTFFFGQIYLWQYPYHPFPWYIPTTTFFAIAVLGGLFNQAEGFARRIAKTYGDYALGRRMRFHLALAAAAVLGLSVAQLWAVARQAEAQQRLVETGNRKQIGVWLRENAAPGDTVFMEPLGYIGFFSGLKTFDFPGMSSPEMIAARHLFERDFPLLISWLEPTWVVVRPREIEHVIGRDRGIVEGMYREVTRFSVAEAVEALDVFGKPYLKFDSEFVVLRREKSARVDLDVGLGLSPFSAARMEFEGKPATFVHSPGALVVPIPPTARKVRLGYGFIPEAYSGANNTDGANFTVHHASTGKPVLLHHRQLLPLEESMDRGAQTIELELPEWVADSSLVLRTEPHVTTRFDYSFWLDPLFEP